MKRSFNNMRLRNKFLVLYIFAVFLPIILTNIIFYTVTTSNVKQQKLHDINLTFRQMKADFLESIEGAIRVSSSLYTDVSISEFFEREYLSPVEYIANYDAKLRGFNKYGPAFSSVREIEFYTDNPTVMYSGGVRFLSDELKSNNWFNMLEEAKDPSLILVRPDDTSHDYMSVIRDLNYFYGQRTYRKIVKINIDNGSIDHVFRNVTFPGEIYLLNSKGNIEYSTDRDINWNDQPIHINEIALIENSTTFTETYDVSYLNGWKIIGVIPEKTLLEEVSKSGRFIFYLAIFNFIIPTFIIILISNSLYSRLMRIISHMKKVKDQDFQVIDGFQSNDEIGTLVREFNRMTRKIKELINDVYRANIQKKDLQLQKQQAHLSALQSQINPHFLFNALETIRMRSLIKNETETANIIQNMAKMLRRSFTWGKDWVTIDEEMKIILSFLEIQQYRFDEKLTYHIDIDPDLQHVLIPNMSILPFVENASIHGIEPKKENGHIIISIQKQLDDVEFIIKDNGPGIEEEKLKRMLTSLKEEEAIGDKVGIKNVYYRLKMYYGSDLFFDIVSAENKGTMVIIKLPANNKNNGI